MYVGGMGIGSGLTTSGIAGIVALPDTRSFHWMFFVAVATFIIGLMSLISIGIIALMQRFSNK